MEKKLYDNCVEILKEELIAAMGCTEPIAIAFVSALARKTLGSEPVSCEVLCSGNIVKNVMGVVVPNSQGQRGIAVAAVLGIVGGDSDRELEVLQSVTPEDVEKARKLIAEGFCTCQLAKGVENLFVEVHLKDAEGHTVTAQIKDHHNNVTLLQKDDTVLVSAKQDSSANTKKGDRSLLTIKGILEFADEVRMEDVKELLDRQIQMNSAISQEGLKNPYGAEVGRVLLQHGNEQQKQQRLYRGGGEDHKCPHPCANIGPGHGDQGGEADEGAHHGGVGEAQQQHPGHAQQSQDHRLGTLANHKAAETAVHRVQHIHRTPVPSLREIGPQNSGTLTAQALLAHKQIDGEDKADQQVKGSGHRRGQQVEHGPHHAAQALAQPLAHRLQGLLPVHRAIGQRGPVAL